ncbi:hypothetical protein MPER_10271 [Moniliophthora perniciosa FA553]|nr:hypothetical protein MPER_10271 [Moniliophthora perniciosa FA553]
MEMPDPMKEWLRSPIQPNVEDPLLWWQEELDRESSSLDKKLCRMAIDILSIPAVSCEMERFFSRSGLMVTKHRHNLMAESTRSATVVGSWYDAGLIPHTEAVQYFNDLGPTKESWKGRKR